MHAVSYAGGCLCGVEDKLPWVAIADGRPQFAKFRVTETKPAGS